jgi:hypothetical protein
LPASGIFYFVGYDILDCLIQVSVHLDSIYRETGWEKLSTRREVKTLCMFYKLNVGNSPEFLRDLIGYDILDCLQVEYITLSVEMF